MSLEAIADRLNAVLHDGSAPGVAGAVVGVAVGDEQISLAHGTSNLNTGQAFTEDTGFLVGSVTKLMTTTVLMRLVERGEVELDSPVQAHVPEFTLSDADAAEAITLRMLVNHTNGIDADTLMPAPVRGRDASRSYTDSLARLGVLFEPGTCIHYTNPGFVVAARVIEVRTGMPFERAIQRELFDPAGMHEATAVQSQALLRRTAVGAFPGADGEGLRATSMFTLPESAAGAGSTPIVTIADMLAFGRMHLRNGVAADGGRVLSAELAEAMRSPTFDLGIPQAPPIGLGWWLVPIAGTTAAWHTGGSPGGTSSFCIVPEHGAAVVSFATGPGSLSMNDLLHSSALEEITGTPVEPPLELSPTPVIEQDVAGEYASFEKRTVVEVEGGELVVTERIEPYDAEQRQMHEGFWGTLEATQVTYTQVAPGQFAPAGAEPASLSGFCGRLGLLAAIPAADGRRAGLHGWLRYTPKLSVSPRAD